jgi:2-polyprenyl-6-methoxyphenol hydroxylase-like FAD-dependent oxidoreductase
MSREHGRHAVVIGASIAGLASARVLADHFERVTILDRDTLGPTHEPRKGVPQGRHAHALLTGGAQAIEQLFPGMLAQLAANGAALIDFNEGRWFQAGGYRAPILVEREVVSASRPFIEGHIRRQVLRLPNVTLESGVTVDRLAYGDGRVRGVRIERDGAPATLRADLVVDCSGRTSSAARWLDDLGYPRPDVVEVRCDVRYATVLLRRRPTDLDGTFAVTIGTPPHGKRSGFMVPIERDRWIVTIASSFGAPSATDEESFLALAASLPSPEIHDVVRRAEWLGPVATHRLLSSKRRRYEQVKRVPAGFLALGDSICSFNPIYGQGMSSAALQAIELGAALAEHPNDERLVRGFYKRAAKIIANPWKIAVGADFAYPECTGPRPAGTDIVNRYMQRVLLACTVSPEVNTEMILVQNLMASPATLMRPSMVRMVRSAAREAERRIASEAASRATSTVGGRAGDAADEQRHRVPA